MTRGRFLGGSQLGKERADPGVTTAAAADLLSGPTLQAPTPGPGFRSVRLLKCPGPSGCQTLPTPGYYGKGTKELSQDTTPGTLPAAQGPTCARSKDTGNLLKQVAWTRDVII